MGWADRHIQALTEGRTVQFRPRGNSMSGRIESGQLVTVEPIRADAPPGVGDVVLCTVSGSTYLHLVKAVQGSPPRWQIGNNKGRINGWTRAVFGRLVKVER
jgi:hypothetical protein